MIAATDCHYSRGFAVAGAVLFADWTSSDGAFEHSVLVDHVEPYEPGFFFKRELPGILKVLDRFTGMVDAVIIDGYVWLGPENRPGLGAHLYRALGERVQVVGVAKNPFKDPTNAVAVLRGHSSRPLFVTAAGTDVALAARHVESMHGPYRITTLLKIADHISREDENFHR